MLDASVRRCSRATTSAGEIVVLTAFSPVGSRPELGTVPSHSLDNPAASGLGQVVRIRPLPSSERASHEVPGEDAGRKAQRPGRLLRDLRACFSAPPRFLLHDCLEANRLRTVIARGTVASPSNRDEPSRRESAVFASHPLTPCGRPQCHMSLGTTSSTPEIASSSLKSPRYLPQISLLRSISRRTHDAGSRKLPRENCRPP